MSSPLRTVILAAASRGATAPLTALASAATTYVAVHYAGAETFGFISLLGTLFLLIPFSDLGLGAAVLNAVSRRSLGRREAAIAKDVTARSFRALLWVGVAVFALAGLISSLGLWSEILAIPDTFNGQENVAALLLFALVALGIPFGLGQRLLVADGATHISTLVLGSSSIVAIVVTSAVALSGGPPLLMSLATPAGILFAAIVSTLYALRRLGWKFAGLFTRRSATKTRVSIWSAAAPMVIVMVGAPLALQTHRLVIAHYGTADELAQYAVGAQFYAPSLSIVTTGAIALWPHFARAGSDRRASWNKSLLLMAGFGLAGAAGLTLLLGPISRLVTGGQIVVDFRLALAFGLLLLVMSAHQPSAMLLTTVRGLWFQAGCIAALAITTVPLGIFSVATVGPAGPVFASAAGVVATTLVPCIVRARLELKDK